MTDPLTIYLASLPGRCEHGAHLATQGCKDCAPIAPTAGSITPAEAVARPDREVHPSDIRPLIRGRIKPNAIVPPHRLAGPPMTADKGKTVEAVYRGHCEVFWLRRSRRHRSCDYSRDSSWFRACSSIQPGQQYVHVTLYPGHDVIDTDRVLTGSCCLTCAAGYVGMDTIVPREFTGAPR